MLRSHALKVLLTCSLGLVVAACGDDDDVENPQQSLGTIVDVASSNPQFNSLVAAVQAAELVDTLNGPGPFTVFAPTDNAFELFLQARGLQFSNLSKTDLEPILLDHVVPGRLLATDVIANTALTAVSGKSLGIQVLGSKVVINGRVQIEITDIPADNGVIHVIDAVVFPNQFANAVETLQASPRFSTLFAAVQAAGLANTVATAPNITIFAPSNDAFDRLPDGLVQDLVTNDTALLGEILQYHVIGTSADKNAALATANTTTPELATLLTAVNRKNLIRLQSNTDGDLFINGTTEVVSTDIRIGNGFIHALDSVLLPTGMMAPLLGNLVEALSVYPRFSSLVQAAVDAPGIATTLTSATGVTLFAPTNEAFATLQGALGNAFPTGEALANVLKYHVVPATIDAATAVGAIGTNQPTLFESSPGVAKTIGVLAPANNDAILTLSSETGNNPDIISVDFFTGTGAVIHVIDEVLVPNL